MEEKDLKKKYNDLLESYQNGSKYLVDHPDEKEKVSKRLEEIATEMDNIFKAIPNATEKEKVEGFKEITELKITAQPINNIAIKENSEKTQQLMSFEEKWKIAKIYAQSSLFPDDFKGHPENVLICIGMSEKTGIDVFTVAQNLHIIKGRLSWTGAFCKTLIEQTKKYKDLELIYFGDEGKDNRGCYLEATRVRDGKRIKGNSVTVELAKKSGWWSRKDKSGNETSKWPLMTDQMLGYRATAFFARLYCPEALNGVMTAEENEDITTRKQPIEIL